MTSNTTLSRRGLLASLPAVAATVAPVTNNAMGEPATKPTAASNADPIFAAIEAHRQASVERHRCAEDADAFAEAIDIEMDRLRDLFGTAPNTLDGLIALFQYSQTTPIGNDRSVFIEFVEMWADNRETENEDTWRLMDWPAFMELVLRRITATA